jgi:hypothetical protein
MSTQALNLMMSCLAVGCFVFAPGEVNAKETPDRNKRAATAASATQSAQGERHKTEPTRGYRKSNKEEGSRGSPVNRVRAEKQHKTPVATRERTRAKTYLNEASAHAPRGAIPAHPEGDIYYLRRPHVHEFACLGKPVHVRSHKRQPQSFEGAALNRVKCSICASNIRFSRACSAIGKSNSRMALSPQLVIQSPKVDHPAHRTIAQLEPTVNDERAPKFDESRP